jgi:DNA polymerase III delta prime subunit
VAAVTGGEDARPLGMVSGMADQIFPAAVTKLGFAGYAGSGKSTVAAATAAELSCPNAPWELESIAGPLRTMLAAMDPIVSPDGRRWNDVVDEIGYSAAKAAFGGEGRRLLQRLGSDALRGVTGERTLLDLFEARAVGRRVVVDDVRLPIEVEALCADGRGLVVWLERAGAGSDGHVTESLDPRLCTVRVANDGPVAETVAAVLSAAAGALLAAA